MAVAIGLTSVLNILIAFKLSGTEQKTASRFMSVLTVAGNLYFVFVGTALLHGHKQISGIIGAVWLITTAAMGIWPLVTIPEQIGINAKAVVRRSFRKFEIIARFIRYSRVYNVGALRLVFMYALVPSALLITLWAILSAIHVPQGSIADEDFKHIASVSGGFTAYIFTLSIFKGGFRAFINNLVVITAVCIGLNCAVILSGTFDKSNHYSIDVRIITALITSAFVLLIHVAILFSIFAAGQFLVRRTASTKAGIK